MASSRDVEATIRPFRGPWEGRDKIIIGIDIGTTQSGVAFAFLQSGAIQTIHRVTKWPGQEAQAQQGKIPTVVWYDTYKRAVSFGAEATSPAVEDQAEDNGWTLAKYFKLHLHPDDMKAKHNLKLDSLPLGVPLRRIYSDFMGYLLKHTQAYFEDRILDGRRIWQQYKSTMEVIIAHPNGWAIREQAFLRTAAVDAGFAESSRASSQVRFVSEAEASVHFCIYHTNLSNRLQPGFTFGVCDAGGSTVDSTLYSVASARPMLKLEEKRASACVQAGAIFVDAAAKNYLRQTFTRAGLGSDDVDEYTKTGIKDFEAFAKRMFSDEAKDYSITIAQSRYNNPSIQTRRGRMNLPGSVIKPLFDICTNDIKSSVDGQLQGYNVSHMLLVGGFGDSPYLRSEFKKRYEPRGCQIVPMNESTSKAVADGAVIWGAHSSVVSRAPRSSYGNLYNTRYSPNIAEHQGRMSGERADGYTYVYGAWSQIVTKSIPLDVKAVSRDTFSRSYSTPNPELSVFEVQIMSYTGAGTPEWGQDKQGRLKDGFKYACRVTANLNRLSGALERRSGQYGKTYWYIEFDVCVRFGGTELEAYLEWKEHGVTRTGPATIVPEDEI